MYRVVSCLVTEHDTWLVLLAVVVCVATALTSFLMYSIADMCSGRRKLLWAALTGVSAGSGIWATHFVAMLAYKGALPTHYEPVATIGSLLIAITLAAVGFAVSTGGNRRWIALGGILIGFAIGTMHFVGMTALVIPGTIEWDSHPRRCLLDTRLRHCRSRDVRIPLASGNGGDRARRRPARGRDLRSAFHRHGRGHDPARSDGCLRRQSA